MVNKKYIALSLLTSILLTNNTLAKDNANLDKIIVTAQKSEEDVQKVPISMSVFNDLSLEDRSISTFDDIAKYTPNLYLFSGAKKGLTSPSIRGLYGNVTSFSSPVALYVDGVPVLNGLGFDDALGDIERIEVLRGPQGTLYGKNSETGVINIITKKPNNQTRGKIFTKAGTDGKLEYGANISGPIVKDKFYASAVFKHDEKDGYVYNTYLKKDTNFKDSDYGKILLRYTPTDNLDISLIASRHENNDGGFDWAPAGQDDPKVASDLEGKNETRTKMAALSIDYTINSKSKITSISTIRQYTDVTESDTDFTPSASQHLYKDSEFNTIAQEFKYEYNFEKAKLLLGSYFDKTDDDWNTHFIRKSGESKKQQEMESDSIGLFTSLFYTLNEKWLLNTGIRYDRENKSQKIKSMGIDQDKTWNSVSPKLSVQYSIDNNEMLYGTIAKGYRSGGFSHLGLGGGTSYDEENLISYEIGYKGILLNDSIKFNSSIYYMDISDMQVEEAYIPGMTYMSNAGEATSKGIELELEAPLHENVSLFTSVGINRTTFDTFKELDKDYSGNYNPYAPKYNFNVGVQYRDERGFYGRVDLNGYGKTYYDKANLYSKDAYELVNAKIGYETDNYDIYVYADNVFDEDHHATNAYFSGRTTVYKEDREIGAKLIYRF